MCIEWSIDIVERPATPPRFSWNQPSRLGQSRVQDFHRQLWQSNELLVWDARRSDGLPVARVKMPPALLGECVALAWPAAADYLLIGDSCGAVHVRARGAAALEARLDGSTCPSRVTVVYK